MSKRKTKRLPGVPNRQRNQQNIDKTRTGSTLKKQKPPVPTPEPGNTQVELGYTVARNVTPNPATALVALTCGRPQGSDD